MDKKIEFIRGMLKIERDMREHYKGILNNDIDNQYLIDMLKQELDINEGKIKALEDCLKILAS